MPHPVDVLVVGGGPAGRALAAACGRVGLRTTLVDPAPDRPWRATYGAFHAELPSDLPPQVVAARARGRAVALTEHALGWDYAVLDVPALRAHLDSELARAGVTVRAGRVLAVTDESRDAARTIHLAGGGEVRAAVVVDAGGHGQPLAGHRVDRRRATTRHRTVARQNCRAEQTAFGVVVDADTAQPLVRPGEALFMDWRPDHGEDGWPTFLYGVPLGHGVVLLEETSLVRRPGLPLADLRRRLLTRLARHGIDPPPDAPTERVRFPVDLPRHRANGVLGFGAAAPLTHPATGFGVATALRLASRVAAAVATALPRGPAAALAAAHAVVWPNRARIVHNLRRRGLAALLRMPPAEVPGFFEVFFGLPAPARWAYLTAREDPQATFHAMLTLYRHASWRLRAQLLLPELTVGVLGG